MNWEDLSAGLVYRSAPIVERRRRILDEARRLIAKAGHENFSIRELARRANVAQKTLYNAFGSKEGIVTSAIVQYARDVRDSIQLDEEHPTLKTTLERMLHFNTRNLDKRSYVVALMAIHNSPTSNPRIQQALRALMVDPNIPFANLLHERGQLAEFITPVIFAERLATFIGAALTDWCTGRVPDSAAVEWTCESFLIGFCGMTTGAARKDGERWIAALRANAPPWSDLQKRVRLAIGKSTPGRPQVRRRKK